MTTMRSWRPRALRGWAILALVAAAFAAGAMVAVAESVEEPQVDTKATTANPIVLWELATQDCHKSAEFFKDVFGWPVTYAEDVAYYRVPIAEGESQLSGGIIFTLRKAKLPFLTLYILVDDIEAKAAAITEAGGLITEPPHEIAPGQSICLFNDPSGCTFAMIEIKREG
jgi:predicted enzyme related to lactoylglutathione lyase